MNVFRLIRQLLEFQKMIGIDLREMVRFIQQVLSLGGPPSVDDEVELRSWLRDLVGVLQDVALETPTTFDDAAIGVVSTLLDNDPIWSVAYSAMVMIFGEKDILPDSVQETALTDQLSAAMATLPKEKVAAINPLVIVAMIRMIVELIRAWRDAREDSK